MKRLFFTLTALFVLLCSIQAQDMKSMVKAQHQKHQVLKDALKINPTSEEKKQAKRLKKEGWTVSAGAREIVNQLAINNRLCAELIHDKRLQQDVHRYISGGARATAGSLSAAKSVARSKALAEIASKVETSLASASQNRLSTSQSDAVTAATADKFHEVTRTLVQNNLTNTETTICIYRLLPTNNYEVEIAILYDKIELAESIKDAMRTAVEVEGEDFFDQMHDAVMLSGD